MKTCFHKKMWRLKRCKKSLRLFCIKLKLLAFGRLLLFFVVFKLPRRIYLCQTRTSLEPVEQLGVVFDRYLGLALLSYCCKRPARSFSLEYTPSGCAQASMPHFAKVHTQRIRSGAAQGTDLVRNRLERLDYADGHRISRR